MCAILFNRPILRMKLVVVVVVVVVKELRGTTAVMGRDAFK
jgi:hypothetical protein